MKPPCVLGEKMNLDCTKLTTKHDVNWMWTVQVKSSTKKVIFFFPQRNENFPWFGNFGLFLGRKFIYLW